MHSRTSVSSLTTFTESLSMMAQPSLVTTSVLYLIGNDNSGTSSTIISLVRWPRSSWCKSQSVVSLTHIRLPTCWSTSINTLRQILSQRINMWVWSPKLWRLRSSNRIWNSTIKDSGSRLPNRQGWSLSSTINAKSIRPKWCRIWCRLWMWVKLISHIGSRVRNNKTILTGSILTLKYGKNSKFCHWEI